MKNHELYYAWKLLVNNITIAVATWKAYIKQVAKAQKSGNKEHKSLLMKAMYYWAKECEKLAKQEKSMRLMMKGV